MTLFVKLKNEFDILLSNSFFSVMDKIRVFCINNSLTINKYEKNIHIIHDACRSDAVIHILQQKR